LAAADAAEIRSGWQRLGDVGIGIAKGVGRQITDVTRLAASAYTPQMLTMGWPTPRALEATNAEQVWGGRAADLASFAVPAARAASASKVLPRIAERILGHAVTTLPARGARQVLDRGRGVLTNANIQALEREARRPVLTERPKWNPKTQDWGVKVVSKPNPLAPTAAAMRKAVDTPMSAPTWPEAAAVSGSYLLGGPTTAALLGLASIARRPLPSSLIAQGLDTFAPALQGATGAIGGAAFRALLDRLARQEPTK
jgi:hypothetical protein